MPPKVALIIPEWKLLNLGVFVEKMKARCLLLPADGQGTMLALPPANTHQAGDTGVSNHCGWETKWPGCECWGIPPFGGTAEPGWALEAGGTPALCPMGRWGLSVVLHLPSLHPSPGVSASPLFQAVPTWQYFFSVIFFIFVIDVSLIEEEDERLGLTVCFCTVVRSEEGVKVC